MANGAYLVGDQVVLRGSAFRRTDHDRTCRVTSLLPQAFGVRQYRVQFDNESFERHVSADDIEKSVSAPPRTARPSSSSPVNSRWVDITTIQIKR